MWIPLNFLAKAFATHNLCLFFSTKPFVLYAYFLEKKALHSFFYDKQTQ